jgi:hypothetical protein
VSAEINSVQNHSSTKLLSIGGVSDIGFSMFDIKKRSLERRREPQITVSMAARISFNHSFSTMDCLVENLSDHGALLALPSPMFLSPQIQVCLCGKTYQARVAWKAGRRIGVAWFS